MWKTTVEQYKKLFQKALDEKYTLQMEESVDITIEYLVVHPYTCGGCKVVYDSIGIAGKITGSEHKTFLYNAVISPREMMCQCDTSDPKEILQNELDREPLFKGFIDNTSDYIYYRYITKTPNIDKYLVSDCPQKLIERRLKN